MQIFKKNNVFVYCLFIQFFVVYSLIYFLFIYVYICLNHLFVFFSFCFVFGRGAGYLVTSFTKWFVFLLIFILLQALLKKAIISYTS